MAAQTFTIAQAPERFRFRGGDRVARTDAEGYADLEHAGVVTDGRWTGDLSGGSYDETYRIRRDDGNYFRARKIHLLRLFDDAARAASSASSGFVTAIPNTLSKRRVLS